MVQVGPTGMSPRKAKEKNEDDDVEDPKGPTAGVAEYPLNTLLIRTEPRAISDVLRRIERGAIKLDPDFERDFVWEPARQSRLIESVLMRIPLPVFYLAEEPSGLVVVDGLQRLTSFKRFKSDELELELPDRTELNGKKFSTLPPALQDRFDDGPLTFYLIDREVPETVRLDIFERVNSGVPLTRQQMRNALYNGPATRLLRELSKSPEFLAATGSSLSNLKRTRMMADREAVNRFLAHYVHGWKNYGTKGYGEFDEFLATALRKLNGDDAVLKNARAAFLKTMKLNHRIFGEHAFRKSRPPQRRSALNLAIFDVLSVGLAKYEASAVKGAESQVRRAFHALAGQSAFSNAISFATAGVANVHTRFHLAERMLRRVLGDP